MAECYPTRPCGICDDFWITSDNEGCRDGKTPQEAQSCQPKTVGLECIKEVRAREKARLDALDAANQERREARRRNRNLPGPTPGPPRT
jgi:hypothetical protein